MVRKKTITKNILLKTRTCLGNRCYHRPRQPVAALRSDSMASSHSRRSCSSPALVAQLDGTADEDSSYSDDVRHRAGKRSEEDGLTPAVRALRYPSSVAGLLQNCSRAEKTKQS